MLPNKLGPGTNTPFATVPITSVDLMERAATACYEWLLQNNYKDHAFTIFCGKGNNGGDGLVIARLLAQSNHPVTVYIIEFGHKGTNDFQVNLARLHETTASIRFIPSEENLHAIPAGDVVIDALLGSGINRPADGLTASLIQHINNSGNEVIAIDIPSGLFVDHSSRGNVCDKKPGTPLAFQCFKPAFLMPENAGKHWGRVQSARHWAAHPGSCIHPGITPPAY